MAEGERSMTLTTGRPAEGECGRARAMLASISCDDSSSSVEDPIRRLLKSFKKQYIVEATEDEREGALNKYPMDPAGT